MDSLVLSAIYSWAEVGNQQSIADCITGCWKAKNILQPIPSSTEPEDNMRILASHENKQLFENKHPFWQLSSKIGIGA